MMFFSTSAKSGLNVKETFAAVATKVKQNCDELSK